MPIDLARDLVIRWDAPDPKHASMLHEAAINRVLISQPNEPFQKACLAVGIEACPENEVQFLSLKDLPSAVPGKPVALTEGEWPGVSRGPNASNADFDVASASTQPWVDSNGSWIGYLRALAPDRPPALGYRPNLKDRMVPFDSLELALIEGWASGGNYVMTPEPRFRSALLKGDEKALSAWRRLGRTGRWLQEHADTLRQPPFPAITMLVEQGEATAEIAHMMYRHNASPALVSAGDPPPPDPARRRVMVAVELQAPPIPVRNRIMAHAEFGASVVVNGEWWRNSSLVKAGSQEDRDVYRLGRGQIVAYRQNIDDPSEFALDVIDILTHKLRPVRLWNAGTVIALATGKGLLPCVNYGSPTREDIQARIQGSFAKATLVRPEAAPLLLKTARRGTTTEVMIPELRRLGILVFE
ncbi:MAG: hypothetical protein U0Q18_07925 [Bryobacteraceae bacterium]